MPDLTIEAFNELSAKVDALIAKLTPKEDAVPEVERTAAAALRVLLADRYPKEKLDAWDLAKLTMAADLLPTAPLPPPPKGTEAKTDSDPKKAIVGYYSRAEGTQ